MGYVMLYIVAPYLSLPVTATQVTRKHWNHLPLQHSLMSWIATKHHASL